MAWIPAAISAAGSIASGYFGSEEAPERDPFAEARANFSTNNPNQYTPYGSVEYRIDNKGTPDNLSDDVYSMVQQHTPEMQGLLNAMMGIAGATPSSFQSHMPEGVRSRMESTFGSSVESPTYTPPEFAFGYDGGPAQAADNSVDTGNLMTEYQFGPNTTNQELVAQAYKMGDISQEDYEWTQSLFNETPQGFGSADSTVWANGDATSLISRLDGLGSDNRARLERLFMTIHPYGVSEPDPVTEPDKPPYDPAALDRLVEAMS